MFMIMYSHHLSSLSAAEVTRRDVYNGNMSLVAATPGQYWTVHCHRGNVSSLLRGIAQVLVRIVKSVCEGEVVSYGIRIVAGV